MLKTPTTLHNDHDPILSLIARMNGCTNDVRVLEEGVLEIGHFSLELIVFGRNAPHFYMTYPHIDFGSYGVCDSPSQFLTKFGQILKEDYRTFVVGFTHIAKDPSNAGEGGGWRWHKWGPYHGEGEPTTEYLDDEAGFADGVYVYNIVQTDRCPVCG